MNAQNPHGDNDKVVTVHVNNKPVELTGPKASGLEIKKAAIAAGLQVELDFLLSLIRSEDNYKRVSDGEEVAVNKNTKFALVSPDHNS